VEVRLSLQKEGHPRVKYTDYPVAADDNSDSSGGGTDQAGEGKRRGWFLEVEYPTVPDS